MSAIRARSTPIPLRRNVRRVVVGEATSIEFTHFYLPTLVWAGSTTQDLPLRMTLHTVAGTPGANFNLSLVAIAFRKR